MTPDGTEFLTLNEIGSLLWSELTSQRWRAVHAKQAGNLRQRVRGPTGREPVIDPVPHDADHHLGPVDDEGDGGIEAADVGWEQRLELHSPCVARTL